MSREHERIRRRILQARSELAILERGELWHPLTEDEYRDLLYAVLEELEATIEARASGTAKAET